MFEIVDDLLHQVITNWAQKSVVYLLQLFPKLSASGSVKVPILIQQTQVHNTMSE